MRQLVAALPEKPDAAIILLAEAKLADHVQRRIDALERRGARRLAWSSESDKARPTPFHMDIAASVQAVLEEAVLRLTRSLATKTGARISVAAESDMLEGAAQALAAGQSVGWFQGRMEFGPRALGARSIIADPRSVVIQKNLNFKIRYRDSFRPFAPAVLSEDVGEWFDLDADSSYMLLIADVAAPARHERHGAGALRHRQAQCRALRDPSGDALSTIRRASRRSTRGRTRFSTGRLSASSSSPAARCWSTSASTCAASRDATLRKNYELAFEPD